MVDDGIKYRIYEETADNILKDLKNFQESLHRNFKGYEKNDNMRPVSNEPAKIG